MKLTRILVAHDFSLNSAPALELAFDLARRFHARIDVLFVYQPVVTPFGEPMLPDNSSREQVLDDVVHERTFAELHRCVHMLRRRGVEADARIEIGDPAQVLVAFSEVYDLIVMGTHGRRGVSRLINGSVAEAVVRGAACPVLTARPPADAEVRHG